MGITRSRILFWALAFIIVAGLLYLSAASTLGFRIWMGDRSLRVQDYPSAILWYTRALRLLEEAGNVQQTAEARSRLYQAYEGFCRWEFDGDRLWGWYAGNQINELLLNNGVLEISATGDDPWLEIIRLRLRPNKAYRFEVRMRVPNGSRAKLYWAALTDVFDPVHVAEFSIPPGGGWQEYRVDLSPLREEIGKLRFIPANASGRMVIDWIRIVPAAEK
jgi:hypothetical protein